MLFRSKKEGVFSPKKGGFAANDACSLEKMHFRCELCEQHWQDLGLARLLLPGEVPDPLVQRRDERALVLGAHVPELRLRVLDALGERLQLVLAHAHAHLDLPDRQVRILRKSKYRNTRQ